MNEEEFIKDFVRINYQDDFEEYGHFPFQMVSENEEKERSLVALAGGGRTEAQYKIAREYINEGSVKLFLSLDFPPIHDIENDFIVIYSWVNNILTCKAITYDTKTGEILDTINESPTLDRIKSEFEISVLN